MKKVVVIIALMAMSFGAAIPAFADSSMDMMSMLESMKQQMTKMQATIDSQNQRIQQLETSRTIERPTMSGTGTTLEPGAAATNLTNDEWQKGIKDNIGDAIPWLKGAKYGGDFRLRGESFDYFKKSNNSGSTGTSGDRSRNRFRIRLRWGFEKDYMDDWKVGFRLATGSTTDQTSTNQTLGNSSHFNFKSINVEKAYVTYEPNGMKDYGLIKGVKVSAGKTDNPFLRYSTPIVWDGDVTPEGVYEQVTLGLVSTEETKLNLYGTLGQFITAENSGTELDAGLYGYQGALNLSTYGFHTDMPVDITGAVSYYDYTNWAQTIAAANNGSATSYLRTNTTIADDFRVLDIYPEVQFYWGRTPIVTWYDYAVNTANVGTEDAAGSSGNDIHDADQAWGAGLKVGKIKKKGSWEAFYGYYEIGGNAVVAAFNDSDFGGPGQAGYTNRQGHKFGGGYALTDAVTLNWTAFIVRPLHATTVVANSTDESVFRSQVDLNYKF